MVTQCKSNLMSPSGLLRGAHNALLDLEELDDETLEAIHARYGNLAKKARKEIRQGKPDVGCEEIEHDFGECDNNSEQQDKAPQRLSTSALQSLG